MNVLYENCEIEKVDTKHLPYTAYVIEYEVDGKIQYDVAVSAKAADIFDHYYDKYKKGFRNLTQSKGIINPRLWKSNKESPKEKVKKKPDPPKKREGPDQQAQG